MSTLTAAIPGPFVDRTKLTLSFIASGACSVSLLNDLGDPGYGDLEIAKGATEFSGASYAEGGTPVWAAPESFGDFAADETVLVTLTIDTEQVNADDRAILTLYSLETNLVASSPVPMPLNQELFTGNALEMVISTQLGSTLQNVYLIFDQALDYTSFYTLTEGVLTRRTYSGERGDNDILLDFSNETPTGYTDSFNGIEFLGSGLWERETVSCSIVEAEPPVEGCYAIRFYSEGGLQRMGIAPGSLPSTTPTNPLQFSFSFLLRNTTPSSVSQTIFALEDTESVNYVRLQLVNNELRLVVRIFASTYTSDPVLLPEVAPEALLTEGWAHVYLGYDTESVPGSGGAVLVINQHEDNTVGVSLPDNGNAIGVPEILFYNNQYEEAARGYDIMRLVFMDGFNMDPTELVTVVHEAPGDFTDPYTLTPLDYEPSGNLGFNIDGRGIIIWPGDLCGNETRVNYLFPTVDDPVQYTGGNPFEFDPEPTGPFLLGYIFECQDEGGVPVEIDCGTYTGQIGGIE